MLSFKEPKVMAIINATTDSFAYSCSNISEAEILAATAQAISDGADIIDIGACSTRPGSTPVLLEEEWRRLEIALRAVREHYPEAIVSVDTFRADIARKAVERFGADIINDISGGSDPEMFQTVADLGTPYIYTCFSPIPSDVPVSAAVLENIARQSDILHKMGVKDVIADPGFGFNKTEEQNYELLAHLSDLQHAELPILVGLSRKSMFYKPLGTAPTSDITLAATTAAHTLALQNGADILRVHDVAAAKAVIKTVSKTI